MNRYAAMFAMALALAAGCAPGVRWIRNPGPDDQGLRYYRPKPYLLITPDAGTGEVEHARSASADPRLVAYRISLCYLPDYAEEYSVHIRPGFGASKLKLTLENGWNLISIDQDLDSKTGENVAAASGLIKAFTPGGQLAPPCLVVQEKSRDAPAGGLPPALPDVYVRGYEVPVGYYESVIGSDPHDGTKRLLGFRYIGFLPFAAGPVDPTAVCPSCSGGEPGPLFGLVLERGSLVFRPLAEAAKPTKIPALASSRPDAGGPASEAHAGSGPAPATAGHADSHPTAPTRKTAATGGPPTPESPPARVGHLVPIEP